MRDLIEKYSSKYGLEPSIVACVILQESAGDTFAWRWEEAFYLKHLKGKHRSELSGWTPKLGTTPSIVDEILQRSCSYGLMQVLGDTARWCGKMSNPYLTALCDPEVGLDIGCKVLKFYLDRASGDYHKALEGYNGSPVYPRKIFERHAKLEYQKLIGD